MTEMGGKPSEEAFERLGHERLGQVKVKKCTKIKQKEKGVGEEGDDREDKQI